MRILVTGATGFIGRHLTRLLESKGIEFVILTRNHIGKNGFKVDLLKSENFIEILEKIKPTHLIHLAWYTEHGKYWNAPLNIDWIQSTFHLLDAFYKIGGEHALITGTCAEYNWDYGYCVENLTPENPTTLYGEAKNTTRRLSELVKKEYGTTLTWARIFFPYGPDEGHSRLIPSLFRYFRGKEPPFGVNTQVFRDFLHVSDVTNALMLCTEKKFDGTLNISSGIPTSIDSVVREIASICGKNPQQIFEMESHRKGEPSFLVGDNRNLQMLGWNQTISLQDGLLTYSNLRSDESL